MKAFVAVAVFAFLACAQALSNEQKAKLREFSQECQQKSGVSQDLINKARKGEFVNDPKLKEHLFCFAKKAGFMNEAGVVLAEAVKARIAGDIGLDEAGKVTQKCATLKAATPQQVAFDVFKCYYENTSKKVSLT